ncbi:Bug family tripartite tricarboxylate transporter substrate binding protein [Caldimonas thermodepolymerans]|jgi:Uncharacterized protein conserved in bacteria|uniref:Tripartite-type tricarboxylate transporter receptor subunit TctC n=1 Tax=Caldimonas thermodepolymerans TaxID=215580 RepID=A0AA46DCS8_9BURK|nr:tripartite tricarboxylate transporter substrate binding protein [Caldimonas thermodepolymerans]TCP06203.1 tripartite-type tricarboxylate transporter receptor subunit TctC [Caldimonas thermodepolymerans]UZG48969.1 tripartite tricarboxylate transporter substrate binding protein [Caldimonas thermodepolymerans]
MLKATRRILQASLLAATALWGAGAAAQGYPERTVRLVIPYAPGGPTDVLGRALAEQLGRELKQSVVAENRPGGGGVIAMSEVARATPDGYTLLLGDINLSVSPALHKSLPFDPSTSFTHIGMAANAPMLVLVPANSPITDMKDLVRRAKEAPGTIAYAHGGVGSPTHLGPEVFQSRYQLKLISVPYKSSGESLTAVAAGHAQVVFTGLSAAKGLLDGGKVRALAVAGRQRSPVLPQVPTMAEAGVPLPELDVGSWWGLLGPANLPPAIVTRLHAALQGALSSPELSQRLAMLNFTRATGGPDEMREWVATETRVWGDVLRNAGIRPE